MKKCPFCKNEIEANSSQCPICKMTLIEKVVSPKTYSDSKSSYTPPKAEKEKVHSSYYTPPNKSYTPRKGIKLPNGSGWVISIIGSIALSAILSNINSYSSSNPLPDPVPIPAPITQPIVATTVPHAPYHSLLNGTLLFSSSLKGSGTLSISNGSGSDAVVKLITSDGRKVYEVYIAQNDSYSIKNINDGTYRLLFEFGSNWDTDQKKFTINQSASSFDDPFSFDTYDTDDGNYTTTHYTTYNITLNPVESGTATTSSVDPNVFDKY